MRGRPEGGHMWLCLKARIRLLQREFIRFKDFLALAAAARPGVRPEVSLAEVSLGLRASGGLCFAPASPRPPDSRSSETATAYSGKAMAKIKNQHKTNECHIDILSRATGK